MKAKHFLSTMVLAILPFCYMSAQNGGNDPKIEYSTQIENDRPRSPMNFSASVEEVNGVLQISFLGSYSDVNIVITDTDGYVVYQETNGSIYDGKTIYINPADGYPYDLEITSLFINIIGVIYLEE